MQMGPAVQHALSTERPSGAGSCQFRNEMHTTSPPILTGHSSAGDLPRGRLPPTTSPGACATGNRIRKHSHAVAMTSRPHLSRSDSPEGTERLVPVLDNPDGPGVRGFTGWRSPFPPSGAPDARASLQGMACPTGASTGAMTGSAVSIGSFPPSSTVQRYVFQLFPLGEELDLTAGAARKRRPDAMEGQVPAGDELIGQHTRWGAGLHAPVDLSWSLCAEQLSVRGDFV